MKEIFFVGGPLMKRNLVPDFSGLVAGHADRLNAQLQRLALKSFPPNARRNFRRLMATETAKLLGVHESRLRAVASEAAIGDFVNKGRSYTLDDLAALRAALIAGTRSPERYAARRRPGEKLQIIVTMNFKGGSAKTTTCAHLLQYLAMRGYRALGVDLDPQASLSALFGIQAAIDVKANETLYGAIRFPAQARRPARELAIETHVPGLSLIPGGLELMEFEHETPRALAQEGALVFGQIGRAIAELEADYDVVVFDCPPQLGFLTLSALMAATSVLITVHPQMLDVMSMNQFLAMLGDLAGVMEQSLPSGTRAAYQWVRYLITRYEPNDGPQTQMVEFIRSMFGGYVMEAAALKSTAISDAGITNQTIYEVDRSQFTRSTYDRAIESVDAVNREIEALMLEAWGRRGREGELQEAS